MKVIIALFLFLLLFTYQVEAELLRVDDQGSEVYRIQRLLSFEGYFPDKDGVYGDLTFQAVKAFQAFQEISVDGVIGPETRGAFKEIKRPKAIYQGDYIEICLSRQILFYFSEGEIKLIALISSGREGRETPKGEYYVYRKLPGWWEVVWRGDWMYSSLYFYESYAIHGGFNVTGYPASLGCIRVDDKVADFLMEKVKIGTKVIIY